jgi:hypothetical protein
MIEWRGTVEDAQAEAGKADLPVLMDFFSPT